MKYCLKKYPASLNAILPFLLLFSLNVSVVPSSNVPSQLCAQEIGQESLKNDFASSSVRLKAATRAFQQKDYLLAQKECEAALSANSNNVNAKELLQKIQDELFLLEESIRIGTSFFESEKYSECLFQAYEVKETCANYPSADVLFKQAAQVLVVEGWNLYARDDMSGAFLKAQEALMFDSDNNDALEIIKEYKDELRDSFSQTTPGSRAFLKYDGVEFVFRYCPPGSYLMGGPSDEPEIDNEEKRQVTLKQGFWIGETETTGAQWNAVCVEQESNREQIDDNYPVTSVDRHECDSFVAKLNELNIAPNGWSFALPTEEQWEYACRAGSSEAFRYSSLIDRARCRDARNYALGEVGALTPNAWGIYDMLGNVREWTCSIDKKKGSIITRGGSYNSAVYCHPACRWPTEEAERHSSDLGLRIILFPSRSEKSPTESPKYESFSQTDPGSRATLKYNEIEIAFRYCPPGSYIMGSPMNEKGHTSAERRWNKEIVEGFWICETETTQALWQAVGVETKKECEFTGDKFPAENVSWNECDAFVKKLNELNAAPDGWRFAIPTEEQWEYACRAGTTGSNFGVPLDECAWYAGNSAGGVHDVGALSHNQWGIYDMLGNVSEWTSSQYENDDAFVYRGGNWNADALRCRPAYRFGSAPESVGNFLGVRLILVPLHSN